MSQSRCYLCERPTKDWQEPCECGSRAFYRGKSLKGRFPDFDANRQVLSGSPWEYGEEYEAMMAPSFLLGRIPHAPAKVIRMMQVGTAASNSDFAMARTLHRTISRRKRGKTRIRREEVA